MKKERRQMFQKGEEKKGKEEKDKKRKRKREREQFWCGREE